MHRYSYFISLRFIINKNSCLFLEINYLEFYTHGQQIGQTNNGLCLGYYFDILYCFNILLIFEGFP